MQLLIIFSIYLYFGNFIYTLSYPYQKDDPSPKLPPKIGNLQLGGSSSSSTSSVNSGYMSSTTSMLSNSSNASSQGSSSVVQLRRHTTVFQSQLGSSGLGDDNPPPLPVKKKYGMYFSWHKMIINCLFAIAWGLYASKFTQCLVLVLDKFITCEFMSKKNTARLWCLPLF